MSFACIEKEDPLASEILQLTIFLDGSKIQKDLFLAAIEVLTEDWQLYKATLWTVELALGCLQSYSLIRPVTGNNVSVHILVQKVMLGGIGKDALKYYEAAINLVHHCFPWGGELENMDTCRKYLPHGLSCIKYGTNFERKTSEVIWLLDSIGLFFINNGQYDEANAHFENALWIKGKEFGLNDINTAATIMRIGMVCDSKGRYNDAISNYQRALRIYENAFGVDHINTADTINNLGNIYVHQGKYDEAIA